MKASHVFLVLISLVVGIGSASCGDDDDEGSPAVVGAPCGSDLDCASRCERGMCTVACGNDYDCPPGTVCVDDDGGTCGVACGSEADCAGFGPGFRCEDRSRKGASGEALICRRD